MVNKFRQLLDSSAIDPDDARRKKLLNTLLVYMSLAAVFILISSLVAVLFKVYRIQEVLLLVYISMIVVILNILIFLLNKRWGNLAAWIFLVLLTLVLGMSDTPQKLEMEARCSFSPFQLPRLRCC